MSSKASVVRFFVVVALGFSSGGKAVPPEDLETALAEAEKQHSGMTDRARDLIQRLNADPEQARRTLSEMLKGKQPADCATAILTLNAATVPWEGNEAQDTGDAISQSLAELALEDSLAERFVAQGLRQMRDGSSHPLVPNPYRVLTYWFRDGHLLAPPKQEAILRIVRAVCADDPELRQYLSGAFYQYTTAAWIDADVQGGFTRMDGGFDQAYRNYQTLRSTCNGNQAAFSTGD